MKVKTALGIVVILFALHVAEEYATSFATTDKIFLWFAQPFRIIAAPLAIFTTLQILLWTFMWSLYKIATIYGKMRYFIIALGGIAMFETHHIYEAIRTQAYYSGLITAIPLSIIGIMLLARKNYLISGSSSQAKYR